MKKQTGDTYQSSKFAKALIVSEAKVGKSCNIIGSLLGVLPWQKSGGVVTNPKHLYILTFDANALGGVNRFLTETCGAPKEALQYTVYNLQDDMREVSESESDYDGTFFNNIMSSLREIREETAKLPKGSVPAVHFSSLTGLAQGIERAIVGPPNGRGYADVSKWQMVAHQLNEIRNFGQLDGWHCIWEAHIYKPPPPPQAAKDGSNAPKETLQVSGKTGHSWAYNVEQVFRMRRQFGQVFQGTKADQVYLDTQPALDFIIGGRNFTEALNAKEYDMTLAFHKLGLSVGRWGAKAAPPKSTPAAHQK